jgi:outer membrane biogenesis lipoprotein LolB
MRIRQITLLLVLITILFACSDTPKPSNAIWDQSTFETANWN